jgi:hypothetical protein
MKIRRLPSHSVRWTWIIGPIIACIAYFYGLNSIYIPTIGDEDLYLQICRTTGESRHWLPLLSERGISNTKPPMLFWQGIISTNWGVDWDPALLRFPIVCFSLLTAVMAAWLAFRISQRRRAAVNAALIYLGFMSTIQQGRPFLTNAPETFFLFAPLVLFFYRPAIRPRNIVICGLLLGAAALYKSFFLVCVGCWALSLMYFWKSGSNPGVFLRHHLRPIIAIGTIGLAIFCLWFAFDPHPDLIVRQFLIKENAGKLRPALWFAGLFSGKYPLWRIWLGNFANAGLYALLLAALLMDLIRRRRKLPGVEKLLWIYILAFLTIYSVPTQRQENYLLPSCAALSVLLALRWNDFSNVWFRISSGIIVAICCGVFWLQCGINHSAGGPLFGPLSFLPAMIVAVIGLIGVMSGPFARRFFPISALLVLLAGSVFLRPFSHRYPASACRILENRTVYFPQNFRAAYEKFRFILPGADVRGYPVRPAPAIPEDATYAAIYLNAFDPAPEGWRKIDSVWALRSRHTMRQVRQMLFNRRLDLLVQRLVICERVRPDHEPTILFP